MDRLARTSWPAALLTLALGQGALLGVGAAPAVAAEDYDYGRAGFGAWTIPVPLDVQAQQDLVPGQGVLVVFVRPGGTASEMGVQPGDVLTSLNNTPVSNRHDIREVIGAVQPGDAATAGVITPDGTQAQLSGTFQERPNRWPGAGAGFGPGPGPVAGPGGPPPGFDPQAEMMEQRHELLAEQIAMSTIQDLLTQLRDRLLPMSWPSGAWQVQFTLAHAPAPAVLVATPSAPTSVAEVPASAADAAAPAWAVHGELTIGAQP
jgi:hypothetical protein